MVKGWCLRGSVILLVMCLTLGTKVYLSSWQEYRKAQDALARRDYHQAIVHLKRTILWYLPGNRYVEGATAKLWQLGLLAERQGNRELALEAYRSLRSGLYAVRSLYIPYREWIKRCDSKIASLMAAKGPTVEADKGKTFTQLRNQYLNLLRNDQAPDVVWSLVMEVGLLGWLSSTIFFILRSFGPEGELYGRRALFWGGLLLIFYILWVVGMVKA